MLLGKTLFYFLADLTKFNYCSIVKCFVRKHQKNAQKRVRKAKMKKIWLLSLAIVAIIVIIAIFANRQTVNIEPTETVMIDSTEQASAAVTSPTSSEVITSSPLPEILDSTDESIRIKLDQVRVVAREDTLIIMARQESTDEQSARLAVKVEPVVEVEDEVDLVQTIATPAKMIVQEVILGQGQDTLWSDERPSPWKRVAGSSGVAKGALVDYQYSYGDRPVKKVEYVVIGNQLQILSEELIQAMLEQYRQNLANVSATETEEFDLIVNLDLSGSSANSNSSNNYRFARVDEVEWSTDKIKVMEFTLRDQNPDLSELLGQIKSELSSSVVDLPFVQVVIHVIRLGQATPNLAIQTGESVPNWLKPDGIYAFSANFQGDNDYNPNLPKPFTGKLSEFGVYWHLIELSEISFAVPLIARLAINNHGHLVGVIDGVTFQIMIYGFRVQFPVIGIRSEFGTNGITSVSELGIFSSIQSGSYYGQSIHLPTITYEW
ncbi:MAG: hypothetical protein WCV73_02475 [Patescibacteria group bacterium]|jgi:hypothetical protein